MVEIVVSFISRRTTVRDGVLQAMALASRTTGHVLGLGLGKHVLGLGHFRLMCLVLCTFVLSIMCIVLY